MVKVIKHFNETALIYDGNVFQQLRWKNAEDFNISDTLFLL